MLIDERTPRLTNRQIEVAHMLLDGMRLREIAQALSISYDTVKQHVAWIYRALGVRSRREMLARYALTDIGG